METISIIIPCYNEEEAIPVYYETMVRQMDEMEEQQKVQFELIFVDDGSKDHSLFEMRRLAQKDMRCRYLSFSRNFGKEAAMYAGLQAAKGDYVTVMDVDLQDPPSLLPKMYAMLQSGTCDCVAARRSSREGEGKIKSFLSNAFYGVINRLSRTEIVSGARDYRLMSRKMVDAVLEMSEYNRFSKGIFGWVGFHTEWLEFETRKVQAARLMHDELTRSLFSTPNAFYRATLVDGITGFSVAPLSLASVMGVLFFLISMILIVFIIGRTLLFGDPVAGWPSMACILFLVSGVQLFCTGIVGIYLSKTYLETKHRPIYLLKETSEETVKMHSVAAGEKAGECCKEKKRYPYGRKEKRVFSRVCRQTPCV